jgi:Family of unknown function (DUF6165)
MSDGARLPTNPHAPISWGELLDKITILELKRERITAPPALANVRRELAYLGEVARGLPSGSPLAELKRDLGSVNAALWDVEDRIREKDKLGEFDAAFIELARSVYTLNDRRAALKRAINLALGSELVEEKSYS